MHIYKDCIKCPFRELVAGANYCKVYKERLSGQGERPYPFSRCVYSEDFNSKFKQKSKTL